MSELICVVSRACRVRTVLFIGFNLGCLSGLKCAVSQVRAVQVRVLSAQYCSGSSCVLFPVRFVHLSGFAGNALCIFIRFDLCSVTGVPGSGAEHMSSWARGSILRYSS